MQQNKQFIAKTRSCIAVLTKAVELKRPCSNLYTHFCFSLRDISIVIPVCLCDLQGVREISTRKSVSRAKVGVN